MRIDPVLLRIFTISALFCSPGFGLAQEPKETPTPEAATPEVTSDPAFDGLVDLSQVRVAWSALDAVRLTDLALQLASAEKVLLREHRGAKAEQVLDLALKAAVETRDTSTLDRLAKAAGVLGLKDFRERVETMKALGAAKRSAGSSLMISADDLGEESYKLLREVLQEIRTARLAGDRAALMSLASEVDVLGDFDDALRKQLKARVTDALKSVSETKGDGLLDLLSAKSRDLPIGITTSGGSYNVPPANVKQLPGYGGLWTTTITNTCPGRVYFYLAGFYSKKLYSLEAGKKANFVTAWGTMTKDSYTAQIGNLAVDSNPAQTINVTPTIWIVLDGTKNARGAYTRLANFYLVNGSLKIVYDPNRFPRTSFGMTR